MERVGTVLSKWLKQSSVPNKDGKNASPSIGKHHFIKVYQLELSNMEGTPVYDLKHQLSIGSEIGNIVIADPSVSPRHATFILQDEVVSVIDHGSVSGTKVTGKKITPGKYIILTETDLITVGDLEIRIKVGRESVPVEVIPEIPGADDERKKEEEVQATPLVKIKSGFDAKAHLKKTAKNKKPISINKSDSANALIRVFAVLCDLILSYSLLVILTPFDEFRDFIDFLPNALNELFKIDWMAFWSTLRADYGFFGQMLQDGHAFFTSTLNIVPLLVTFILTRFITTLILGVSLSELCLGIRASGNIIWTRIGGGFRVLIGIITWPFIIFDLPSIVSKRTLKEVVTFTHISLPSKFYAILGILFYLPVILTMALISPLVQGLEFPQSIIVNDKIDQRIKVKAPESTNPANQVNFLSDYSESMKFEIRYDPNEVLVIPNFKFQGIKDKLKLKSSVIFHQRDLNRQVELEVFKKFDFKQLLGIGMRGNFLLYEKYPQIYNFIYSSSEANPNYKVANNEKLQSIFANEFILFTKMAFSLDATNALDLMQEETFLIKGLINYKSSFLSLIEYKDFDSIGFIKLGNLNFMKISYNKQKPFDLIIPLSMDEGRIFKVSFDKKEDSDLVASRFYKYNLYETNWLSKWLTPKSKILTVFDLLDLFSNENFKTRLTSSDQAQALYAFCFETSTAILKKGNPFEIELWKSKIENIPKLIEEIPAKISEEDAQAEEDPKGKLLQNFKDIIDALENKNFEYFGISQTTTV